MELSIWVLVYIGDTVVISTHAKCQHAVESAQSTLCHLVEYEPDFLQFLEETEIRLEEEFKANDEEWGDNEWWEYWQAVYEKAQNLIGNDEFYLEEH